MLVSSEVFALVKKLEAVVRHIQFTPDGETYVCEKEKDKLFSLPLEVEELVVAPLNFTPRHHGAMKILYGLTVEIRELKRAVPPTREELIRRGASKKDLGKLCSWGLVKQQLVPMHNVETQKMAGVRNCIYFTNQGRAYVRRHIDSEYGLAGKALWESVADAADAHRAATRGGQVPQEHS